MISEMKNTLKIFKALSDRNRLRIIKILQHKNSRCVCEIGEVLGIGQPATSRHLKILEEAGLIVSQKDGKWVNYSLIGSNGDEKVLSILSDLMDWLNDDPGIVNDFHRVETVERCNICCNK